MISPTETAIASRKENKNDFQAYAYLVLIYQNCKGVKRPFKSSARKFNAVGLPERWSFMKIPFYFELKLKLAILFCNEVYSIYFSIF